MVKLFPHSRLYNTYGVTESGCTVILEFSKYGDKYKDQGVDFNNISFKKNTGNLEKKTNAERKHCKSSSFCCKQVAAGIGSKATIRRTDLLLNLISHAMPYSLWQQ